MNEQIEALDLNLALPNVVTSKATKAHAAIIEILRKDNSCYTGGCRAFYSPAEWATRGELFGTGSLLVVVHDGSELAKYFNIDYEQYALHEKMVKALDDVGCYVEQCTSWYSAIYPKIREPNQ